MSADNRFRPPEVVVADVGIGTSRAPMFALAAAGLLQFCWLASKGAGLLELVDTNALSPIGLLFALAGEVCLGVAIVRAAWRRRRPQKTLIAAIALMAACVWLWRFPSFYVHGPFVLGMVVAAIGLKVGLVQGPTNSATGAPS